MVAVGTIRVATRILDVFCLPRGGDHLTRHRPRGLGPFSCAHVAFRQLFAEMFLPGDAIRLPGLGSRLAEHRVSLRFRQLSKTLVHLLLVEVDGHVKSAESFSAPHTSEATGATCKIARVSHSSPHGPEDPPGSYSPDGPDARLLDTWFWNLAS